MIELTPDQQQLLSQVGSPAPRLLDPSTNTKYVLLPEDVYDRLRHIFDGDDDMFIRDLTPQTMELFGQCGWDDPSMDIYNDLDPRNGA